MQAVWIEIPVRNIERAIQFYQAVFHLSPTEVMTEEVRRTATLINTTPEGRAGISLNQTKNFEPSDQGPLIYLDAGEDLTEHLNRVEPAGGKLIEPKTSMGDAGNYATILDTEGNLLALYSYK
jgi:predicted enzyme related to lactoylglutathione lyase